MASIEKRTGADGKVSYRAAISIRIDGVRVRDAATFDRESTGRAWGKRREKEIRERGADAVRKGPTSPTVADAVAASLDGHVKKMGSTKRQVLTFFATGRADICATRLSDIRSADIRALGAELAAEGRGPATVSSYLTHLCYVLAHAEDDFGPAYRVDLDALVRGKASSRRAGISGKPVRRERRPTMAELDAIMDYFARRAGDPRTIPMHLIVPFAIFGVRRQSEILNLRWDDMDGSDMLVRGMKNPRIPGGLDTMTELTVEARRIIDIHGRRDPVRVFPYSSDVVSRLFTKAVRLLGIEDLHYHDLRHEGVSWLRERGWSVSHVMLVSGHSATSTLDRYSQVRERGDKYANWKWWAILEDMSDTS